VNVTLIPPAIEALTVWVPGVGPTVHWPLLRPLASVVVLIGL